MSALGRHIFSRCNFVNLNVSMSISVSFASRKCECMTGVVRSTCGQNAADWMTQLLNQVRASYVTCSRRSSLFAAGRLI